MIEFLVKECADSESDERVSYRKNIVLYRRESVVYDYDPEILDINVNGVEKEELLVISEYVCRIEYSGHIHKEHSENAPKILHIPEENEQSRKNEAYSEIENDQTNDRHDKLQKAEGKGYTVDYAENEEYSERKTKVDERGNISRKQEQILRHVYL